MGKYFKEFCDKQRKLRSGHVSDLIGMLNHQKDEAVVAYLKDSGQIAFAINHPSMSEDDKNECYSSLELVIQDCIEKYNYGVDLDKELSGDIPLANGERACV